LQGYKIEFIGQYISQGHYVISTLWRWSTDECVRLFLYLRTNVHL